MTPDAPQPRDVVLMQFPFSDLSARKPRPALVWADAGRGDWVLCQITSKPYGDPEAVPITDADFDVNGLQVPSFVRPAKLFTAHQSLMQATAGRLGMAGHIRVCDLLTAALRRGCS
jgi:mRNA interferase MazF